MSKRPARDKLLAEWFWTDRWMGSSGFLLPLEARGLYREMLTQAWHRGGRLPRDHEGIQRACGVTRAEWKRAWPAVSRYWREDGDGLVNDTQLEVLEEARVAVRRASEHGRRGAQARHGHHKEDSPGDARGAARAPAQGLPGDKPPSPSLSRTATAAAAAPGPMNGRTEDQGLSKSFLSPEAFARMVAEGERYLDALMASNPDQDRAWLLRQHSTPKRRDGQQSGGGWLVRLDTAGHEHLIRTVHSLRDAVEKAKAADSGEHGGLLTAAEHERRRQG